MNKGIIKKGNEFHVEKFEKEEPIGLIWNLEEGGRKLSKSFTLSNSIRVYLNRPWTYEHDAKLSFFYANRLLKEVEVDRDLGEDIVGLMNLYQSYDEQYINNLLEKNKSSVLDQLKELEKEKHEIEATLRVLKKDLVLFLENTKNKIEEIM